MQLLLAWLIVGLAVPSVTARREGGRVLVDAEGFAAGTVVEVALDTAWPHASVACDAKWTRSATANAAGRVHVVLEPRGECAVGWDREGWIVFARSGAGVVTKSALFH